MKISDDAKIALYLRMNGGRAYIPENFKYQQLKEDRIIHLVDISTTACQARLEEYRRDRIRS